MSRPPQHYRDFVERFPELDRAWEEARSAEQRGPLDESSQRLIKLGIAIATRGEGATHSAARKALAAGVRPEALYQVVALAASTVGFPTAVAAYGWVHEVVRAEAETATRPPRPDTRRRR